MASTNYNSVGAGVTPKLGKNAQVEGTGRPGGQGQHTSHVKVSTDIPKVARPGGSQHGGKSAGAPPKAARPGGPQGA